MSEAADAANNIPAIILFSLWWTFLSALDLLLMPRGSEKSGLAVSKPDDDRIAATGENSLGAELRRLDPTFDTEAFLSGARRAYETVLQAYAKGDPGALRPLLSAEVWQTFAYACTARCESHETLELAFIGIEAAEVDNIEITAEAMEITVLFHAQIVSVERFPFLVRGSDFDTGSRREKEMAEGHTKLVGPDLVQGIALSDLPDGGKLVGYCGGDQVLLVRRRSEVFATAATCTHYGGPLAEGLVVGDTIRCPWHHACFDLRTGEALRAPALSPLACWTVEQRDGQIFVGEKRKGTASKPRNGGSGQIPAKIVIVGGGAAGFAAAETLRREQYQGSIVMISNDHAPPVDRPSLSKEYLAGKEPDNWVPLRGEKFYSKNNIDLRLDADVVHIDPRSREVVLADKSKFPYDRLLLATGAEPTRLTIPGSDQSPVHTLRSLADCKAIIERAKTARRCIVLGASFIGLEVGAALRSRGIDVHVVAPGKRPMERVLGAQMGDFIRALHEENGVVFHLEETATSIDGGRMTISNGGTLEADFIVAGIGVRPRIELAEKAGLSLDRGVAVNSFLETSASEIFAAGDIARWPDPHSGENIRAEHWVVAERQGRTAALNMLGHREKFAAVPFFWSQHYDVPINYVGHAEQWDEITVEGDIAAKDCMLRFQRGGRTLAVASIFRDIESLEAEVEMEGQMAV